MTPVTTDGRVDQPGPTPPLPSAIWVVAWASVAGQLVVLARQGGRQDADSLFLSVILGALVVPYVAAGVVRARTVRTVLAWVVLVISGLGELLMLFSADDLGEAAFAVASLATTVLTLVALARFRRSDWYAWQRTKPSTKAGAPIGHLVAIAVLVGVLGGITGPVEDGINVDIRVADR